MSIIRNALASFLLVVLTGFNLWAQSAELYITDGQVRASQIIGATMFIGGDFDLVGPATGRFALLDTTTAARDASWPRVNGTVFAILSDGEGGYYIGGSFDRVGTFDRQNIAHIHADRTVDESFDPHANDTVYDLDLFSGTLYAAGSFSLIGTQFRSGLASLDPATGLAGNFDPGVNGTVYSIVIDGSVLYAAGSFTNFAGEGRTRGAAVTLPDGVLEGWDPDADDTIFDMEVSDDAIIVGGDFQNIGGASRNRIAALNKISAAATGWNPNASDTVFDIVLTSSSAFVGGQFTDIGGLTRNRLAEINLVSGNPTSFAPDMDDDVNTLASDGISLFVGGDFQLPREHLVSFDIASGALTSWDPRVHGPVNEIGLGAQVAIGGTFAMINGTARENIAGLDLTTGAVNSFNPGCDGPIYTMTTDGTLLYVGGNFSTIGGQTRNNIALLGGDGILNAWNPGADSSVRTFLRTTTALYVAGDFTNIASTSRFRGAVFDATNLTLGQWDPLADNDVYALALDGPTMYVGGAFQELGGQARLRIGATDAVTGAASDWNPQANGDVNALALANSYLYVGGDFTAIGSRTRNRLAALRKDNNFASDWDPNADDEVEVLRVFNSTVTLNDKDEEEPNINVNTIFVGGAFSEIAHCSHARIAQLDLDTGFTTSWHPNASGGRVYDINLTVVQINSKKEYGQVYAGGDYTSILNFPYQSYTEVSPLQNISEPTTGPIVLTELFDGQKIQPNGGVWIGAGDIAFLGEWYRCNRKSKGSKKKAKQPSCDLITTEPIQFYELGPADVGFAIRADAVAQDSIFSSSVENLVTTDIVGPKSTIAPVVTGEGRLGKKLTVTRGDWNGVTGLKYRYQFQRCSEDLLSCNNVGKRKKNLRYKLKKNDIGQRIRVIEFAQKNGSEFGESEASTATDVILPKGG